MLHDLLISVVPTVMESRGILASHGKSWKMERFMEKSWNFNHLWKKFLSCKNKQHRWKISRMAKNATKMRHFQAKISKIFCGGGTAPSPDPTPTGREIPLTRPLTLGIYLCTYFLVFWALHVYKYSWKSINLVWKSHGKVMEIDFSKVVGTMDFCSICCI